MGDDPADHTSDKDTPGDASASAPPDRRREPRVRVELDATIRRLGHSDPESTTSTIDVSHGGARIAAPAPLAVGDVLELGVRMSHGIELTLQGLVVQISDAGGHHAHVAFDSLSTTAAELLTELLSEQSAEQAANGLDPTPGVTGGQTDPR